MSEIASNPLTSTYSSKGRTLPKKIFVPGKSPLNHLYRRKLHFEPLICEIDRKNIHNFPSESKEENTNDTKIYTLLFIYFFFYPSKFLFLHSYNDSNGSNGKDRIGNLIVQVRFRVSFDQNNRGIALEVRLSPLLIPQITSAAVLNHR